MRICLLAEKFPANASSSVGDRYLSSLASGLAASGHEITVVRASGEGQVDGVKAVSIKSWASNRRLKVVSGVSAHACSRLSTYLDYWHCISETLADETFDMFETTQSNAAALLTAFSRQCPTVVRLSEIGQLDGASGFDRSFENMITGHALNCVDAVSAGSEVIREQALGKFGERVILNQESDPRRLAERAISIYELAQREFEQNQRPNLYRHGSARLLKSTEDMLSLYDKMLYDLLYQRSYRFRLRHWLQALSRDPKAFISKAGAKLGIKS